MVSYNNCQKDIKKPYRLCVACNTPVVDIQKTSKREDGIVTVNLNYKRHICSGPELINHEEKIVEGLQLHIKNINELELSSFQLGLTMDEADGT